MTTDISPINPANPYGASSHDIAAGEYLSGESLMFYISTRLNDLDGSISELMGKQEDALDKKEYVNQVKTWAEELKQAANSDASQEEIDAIYARYPWPPEGHAATDLARELYDAHQVNVGKPVAPFIDGYLGQIEQTIDEIDGQSELNMIRLQQCMGERQTAIQLTTNILSKFNAGMEAIVGNLR